MLRKIAYKIKNIEEYGKLISYCIENDICVFRTYWDDREKGKRCYSINWNEKRCHYSSLDFYKQEGYEILDVHFNLNDFGKYELIEIFDVTNKYLG